MNKFKSAIHYAKCTWEQFSQDDGFMMAGALSYYTLFSIAPLLVIVLALLGLLTSNQGLEQELFRQLGGIMGTERANELQSIVGNINSSSSGTIATIVSSVTLLISATAVVIHLKTMLNKAWNVIKDPKLGFKAIIIDRVLSLGFLVGIGFVFLVSLGLNAVAVLLSDQISAYIPLAGERSIVVVSFIIGVGISFMLFYLLFKYLPDTKLQRRDLFIGALATTILFTLGKYLIAYYLGASEIGTTYGSAGALASFMIWVYYNAVIVIFGAEFTQVYAQEHGRSILPTEMSVKVERLIKKV